MAATRAGLDGVLLLDKPAGYSSTRALARARRLLAAGKAGHTGTLDPFATGLLPLAFGEATKFSRFLIDARKSYEAVLRLGVETTTGDPEGELLAPTEVGDCAARIDEVLAAFLGSQDQVPPMHSAIHVDGRRLYEYARAGQEVERPVRRIEIDSIRKLFLEDEELGIAVTCSKGTYIRSLAMDIGRALGCGAHLVRLRRTAVGPLRVEDASTLEELEQAGIEAARSRLLPLDILVASLPRCEMSADNARRFTQGQNVPLESAASQPEWALYGPGGRFLGVARGGEPGWLTPVRLMATGGEVKSPDFA